MGSRSGGGGFSSDHPIARSATGRAWRGIPRIFLTAPSSKEPIHTAPRPRSWAASRRFSVAAAASWMEKSSRPRAPYFEIRAAFVQIAITTGACASSFWSAARARASRVVESRTTMKSLAWRFPAEGAQFASSTSSRRTASGTGSDRKARMLRRERMAEERSVRLGDRQRPINMRKQLYRPVRTNLDPGRGTDRAK